MSDSPPEIAKTSNHGSRGSAPGERRGGRGKGTPNKVTQDARDAFRRVYERRLKDLDRWLGEVGDGFEVTKITKAGEVVKLMVGKDPGKAADILTRMAEHFVPKLARHEVTGDGGGPVEYVIRDMAKEPVEA